MDKFYKDLKQGDLGEQIIAEEFYKRGWEILEFRKDKLYDIKIKKNFIEKKLEIKTDRFEFFGKITNNMFLELYCSGKPSGILGSEADYFIYYYPDWELAYKIKMSDVRKLIPYGSRTEFSGDGGRVQGVLINRFEFSDWFKILKIKKDFRWKSLEGERVI